MRWIEFRTGLSKALSTPTERLIARARAIVLVERVWPRLWPGLGILAFILVLSLSGAFVLLPGILHLVLLAALLGGAAHYLWRDFKDFKFPSWEDGARRIERDSGLAHRPITEAGDTMAAGKGDPFAESLWREHILALLASAKHLRLGWPRAGMNARDPKKLRYVALACVVAAAIFAGRDSGQRLFAGLVPQLSSGEPVALNAWISPPSYTGEAPRSLVAHTPKPVVIPAGSMLILRVRGAPATPELRISPSPRAGRILFARTDSGYEARVILRGDTNMAARLGASELGAWHFKITRDMPPVISFTEPPSASAHQALKFAYRAQDDYGVVKVDAEIVPAEPKPGSMTDALIVPLPVPAGGKDISETAYRDLTAHPYAGLKVNITLIATDAGGNIARSKPATITLPERIFTEPLARAIIEQRRELALNVPQARPRAAEVMDALTVAPERFFQEDYKTYLGVRTLYHLLMAARTQDDIDAIKAYMWELAVAIEEGDAGSAAAELRRVQEQLMSALERGASQAEIDALMDRLRQAMSRYLQALAQNAQKNPQGQNQSGRTLSSQDLDDILKAIQNLSQTGSNDAARQALAALMRLLENLQVSQGPPSPQDQAMGKAIEGLSDLMGKQRELMDKTFRAEQGQKPQGNLPDEQKKLGDQLNDLMTQLGKTGVPTPGDLGQAGKSMGQSQQNLRGERFGSAEQNQQDALSAMRAGAQQLAKSLMESQNKNGTASGNADPLGRPSGGLGAVTGDQVKVPTQSDLQRAREILDELRKRAGDYGRAREELEYIERLLKRF